MYLSDKDILEEMRKGNLSITPFNPDHLTPNGYDLSISIYEEKEQNYVKYTLFKLNPNDFIKIGSIETITLGKDLIGFMFLRSKYSREGLTGNFAVIDAGFSGQIKASLKHNGDKSITIEPLDGVIHLVIARLENPASQPYGGKKSHYQYQKAETVSALQ
ncbi:MAG: dCTP deaminase [Candidatus Parvarchaeota archaeon]